MPYIGNPGDPPELLLHRRCFLSQMGIIVD